MAENSKQEFELVSNIAFANMAAEAIACFREPNENQKSLKELTVYFDSPLLLDVLGVNPEYAEYGRELLESVTATRCPSICDSEFLFLTRNTPLVSIANKAWEIWLKSTTKHGHTVIEGWAPISMSDKQFAGYLWARSGRGDGHISKIRLLAHCSSAIKPRANIKAKTYSLVLDLYGKEEAETFEALLTDREGVQALMRATNGDLEDATAERMPLIMEKMKIAVGEFAAQRVRQEAAQVLQEKALAYKQELKELSEEKAREEKRLAQMNDQTQRRLNEETKQRQEIEDRYLARQQWVLNAAFKRGLFVYDFCRWSVIILVSIIAGILVWVSTDHLAIASFLTSAVVATMSWFVPDYLNRPFYRFAMAALRQEIQKKGEVDRLPLSNPDFKNKSWVDTETNLKISHGKGV